MKKKLKGFLTIELTMITVIIMAVIIICLIMITNEVIKTSFLGKYQSMITNEEDFTFTYDISQVSGEVVYYYYDKENDTESTGTRYGHFNVFIPTEDLSSTYGDNLSISMSSISSSARRLNRFEYRKEFEDGYVYEDEQKD